MINLLKNYIEKFSGLMQKIWSGFIQKFNQLFAKVMPIYIKIKPYLAITIFWSFYTRGFLLLPYGNIFDARLFLKIFSFFLFLSIINYSLFFNLTLKVIEKILSWRWSRKWLGLYHCLSAHLAFFPTFFFCLFLLMGAYQVGFFEVDPRNSEAFSEVIIKALREIGRPAFIIFFPLQLSHFLFKAFDWNAIGLIDKTPYNVIFKKPGDKNASEAMLNFIKRLEEQGKLSIYDDRSVVLDSLGQPGKENWMVCLYNEVLMANQHLIKINKWYAPGKIELPSFFKEEIKDNKTEAHFKLIDSPLFYLAYGGIKNVTPGAEKVSSFFTNNYKAIIAATGVVGSLGGVLGGAYQLQQQRQLGREKLQFEREKLQFEREKLRFDEKWRNQEARDKVIQDFNHISLSQMEKKLDCSNRWTKSGIDSCNNRVDEFLKQIEKQKKERLEEISRPPKGGRFPYSVLEGDEVNPGFFKRCFSFILNLFF